MFRQRGSYVHYYGAFVLVMIGAVAVGLPALFLTALVVCAIFALLRVLFLVQEGRNDWQGRDWRGRPRSRPRPMSDEELYFGRRARRY